VLCKPCSKGKPKEFHLIDSSGYLGAYLPKSNPFYQLADTDGRVKRHRLIMAQLLAGYYDSVNVAVDVVYKNFVHHKDGDRLNNRIDNLLLCTHGEHSTMHRQMEWAEFGSRRRQS